MEKNALPGTRPDAKLSAEVITDSLMLRAYAEALKRKERWQTGIDKLISEVLGLGGDQPFDPAAVPSADEIRRRMSRHIPESEKLSDLVVAMREE